MQAQETPFTTFVIDNARSQVTAMSVEMSELGQTEPTFVNSAVKINDAH